MYYFAADPLSQGADYLFTQGVLGAACVLLIIVIIYQQRKGDKKDARIEELQDLRLSDSKEVSKQVTEVLQGNSQSNYILAEKIEAVKGKRNGSI